MTDITAAADPSPPDRDQRGRFLTGNSGGGRKPGARNKLSEAFLEKLAADFQDHGGDVIVRVRTERPADYLRLVASLCPRTINLGVENPWDDVSDSEIGDLLNWLRTLRAHMSVIDASSCPTQ